MNDIPFEWSVFWPSDTESQINELRFSDSVSLFFKTRITLVMQSGSVVEYLTHDGGAAGLSLTSVTVLCP